MSINSLKHKIAELHAGKLAMVPTHYANAFEEMIPTIDCFKHASAVGEINIYYLEIGEFTLSYIKFLLKRNATLALNSKARLVELRLPYLNHFTRPRKTIHGMNLVYASQTDTVLRIPANRLCSSFNIGIRPEMLGSLAALFPRLDKFLVTTETGKGGRMLRTDLPCPVEILAQVQQILHCKSGMLVRRSLLANQLFQIFVMALEKLSLGAPSIEGKIFTKAELEKLQSLRDYLAKENAPLPPMHRLASQFCLKQETAESGFRKLYGLSIARFHRLSKLNRVRIALKHTDMDKYELGAELGYDSPASFVDSFADQFGCTPGYLQNHYHPHTLSIQSKKILCVPSKNVISK